MPNKIVSLLDQIIFKGNLFLPLNTLKRSIYIVTIVIAIVLALFHSSRNLGNLALLALAVTIFIRPTAQIFPTIGLFKILLAVRRQIGNACAIFVIGHLVSLGLTDLPNTLSYSLTAGLQSYYFWGLLALLTMIPMALTSNDFAVRTLKSAWKKVHLLVHPFFIFALIHKGIREGYFGLIKSVFILAVLYLIRLLAKKNFKFLQTLTGFSQPVL